MMWWHPVFRFLLQLLLRTLRIEKTGDLHLEGLFNKGQPFVLVFWHGSMLVPWWLLRNRGAAALVSMSRDGEILARVLSAWGYDVLRGSSSRGGKEAMAAMRGVLNAGSLLCVTPDGPRGPACEMKMGAVRAAQTTGAPLLCMAATASRHWNLRSWDNFEIPLPFSRVRVEFLAPERIDPGMQGETLEERRLGIEKALLALHRNLALDNGGC